MAPNKVLLTQFVKPISREEQELELKKLSLSISQRQIVEGNNVNVSKSVKKGPGRPRKVLLPQMTLLTSSQPPPTPVNVSQKKSRRGMRGPYQNWFTYDKWPLIYATVKQHRGLSAALHYLKFTHRYVFLRIL